MTAAGNRRADVGIGVLDDLFGRRAEQLFEQIRPAGDAEFLRKHAQRTLRCDKMDALDALVGFERAEQFAPEDDAGGSGDGDG